MTGKDLDLSKVSTPRTAKVLMQQSWKQDMKELAQQLELENILLRQKVDLLQKMLDILGKV